MSASAFVRRDVPSRLLEPLDAATMQPLDSNLLPKVFSSAFGLPVTRFDQVDASLAGVAPVFKLPLPFAVRLVRHPLTQSRAQELARMSAVSQRQCRASVAIS